MVSLGTGTTKLLACDILMYSNECCIALNHWNAFKPFSAMVSPFFPFNIYMIGIYAYIMNYIPFVL